LKKLLGLIIQLHRGGRWQGNPDSYREAGGVGFALIPIAIGILWLLSFFQEKESNKAA
jgi:hypothetical protein